MYRAPTVGGRTLVRHFYFVPAVFPSSGQGIGEVVGVVAVFDDDFHGTLEAGELGGAGIGDYDYVEVEDAGLHGAVVLEDEGAGAAVEGAGDALDGYVTARAFD